MAEINDYGSLPALEDAAREMLPNGLVLQDVMQRGAEHALEALIARGVSLSTAVEMLASVRLGMSVTRRIARERGVSLLDFSPEARH